MLFGRRIRFALIVLASQLLLIALAVVMLIQMILITVNGAARFVENNQAILIIKLRMFLHIARFYSLDFIKQFPRNDTIIVMGIFFSVIKHPSCIERVL